MRSAAILVGGLLCLLPAWPAAGWPGLPPWAGLLTGALVALTMGNPWSARTRPLVSILLAWAVAGLGAAMDLKAVLAVGLQGFGYTAVGITLTVSLGLLLGRWLAVKGTPAVLVSLGTAICGGSAIAAAAPVLQADEADTGVALATVFLLNAAALLIFPWWAICSPWIPAPSACGRRWPSTTPPAWWGPPPPSGPRPYWWAPPLNWPGPSGSCP